MSLALRRYPVQTEAASRLQAHVAHLRDMVDRHALEQLDTWHRVVETAQRTGHSRDEAEQMGDDWLMNGPIV